MTGPGEGATILPPNPPVSDVEYTPAGAVPDPTRVRVEVVTTSNRAASAEFRFRLDTVEVWFAERLHAVFDRERLRSWLAHPAGWIAEGEVTLSVDPRSRGERIAIDLPDVLTWTLSPKELAALRLRV